MKERQIRALADSGTCAGKPLHATIEETHISWVILASAYAFKIKKPLRLSFLDFSTLSKRKKYCEKEVQLNRRFSDIYIGVVPVKSRGGRLVLSNGGGRVIDYAVKMKRMQSSKRMDSLLKSGRVTGAQIRTLARVIAALHRKATIVGSAVDPKFFRNAFNDIRVVRAFVAKNFSPRYSSIILDAIQWSNLFLRMHGQRLGQRIALGFRRDVHGDLHSGNIFLYRRPVIFDCIEFNDAYRQVDVLNEIAFFCMDLEAYRRGPFARMFLIEYNRRFPCLQTAEDLKIFTYFKCYRANVRAKVHALAARGEDNPDLYARHLKAIRIYLDLMQRYMRELQ